MQDLGTGRRLLVAITGMVFAGIPVLAWIMTAHELSSDRQAKATWIATDCVIQEARIWQTTGGRPSHISDGPFDVASIKYEYNFHGVTYTSDAIDLRSIDRLHSNSDRNYVMFVRGYRSGQRTRCWVNPQKPDQAVLAIDMPADAYPWQWMPGIFFVLFGVTLLTVAQRRSPGPLSDSKLP